MKIKNNKNKTILKVLTINFQLKCGVAETVIKRSFDIETFDSVGDDLVT